MCVISLDSRSKNGVNLYPEDNNISEKGINQIFLILCVGAMPMETEKRMARKCIRKI